MKNFIYVISGCLALLYSCQKDNLATDYKEFYNGHEISYTGAVGLAIVQPGNLKMGLKWKTSSDPSIVKYVVYYNNGADSQVVNIAAKTDTIRTVIKNLEEYTYSFTIYSYDAKGNKSVPYEVNNAKVYGPVFAAGLQNRGFDGANPYLLNDDGSLQLNFVTPDTAGIKTLNIKTTIKYTNAAGVASEATLLPSVNTITLPGYKLASPITYQSYYIPEKDAIDTFAVAKADDFPRVYYYVECDKSLFKEVHLPNDVTTYEPGTSISKLWDGSVGPQAYPNIFHSDGSYIPHVLTFDLGRIYNSLGRIEETGTMGAHNPDSFEVWGIADLTNATTTLRPDDAGWKDEAIARGWVLLQDISRPGDGLAPVKFDLISNPPPVRYIRIRVKHSLSNSGYSNMSELTFWNKQ